MHYNSFSIAPFLAMFSNLKEFSWCSYYLIKDSTLSQLQSLQCPLEALKIIECTMLRPKCVVEVVTHFSATLRCLESCVLDATALMLLSRLKLPNFVKLSTRCKRLETCSALVQFCESVSGTVESLSVTFFVSADGLSPNPPAIVNDMIKQITKCCHRLKVICFSSVAVVVSNFPVRLLEHRQTATVLARRDGWLP